MKTNLRPKKVVMSSFFLFEPKMID